MVRSRFAQPVRSRGKSSGKKGSGSGQYRSEFTKTGCRRLLHLAGVTRMSSAMPEKIDSKAKSLLGALAAKAVVYAIAAGRKTISLADIHAGSRALGYPIVMGVLPQVARAVVRPVPAKPWVNGDGSLPGVETVVE